jgi:hypothetical protein
VKWLQIRPCTFGIASVFTATQAQALGCRRNSEAAESKSRRGKNSQTGGSDPTFSASSRPKSIVGSLPPCTLIPCRFFRGSVGPNIL